MIIHTSACLLDIIYYGLYLLNQNLYVPNFDGAFPYTKMSKDNLLFSFTVTIKDLGSPRVYTPSTNNSTFYTRTTGCFQIKGNRVSIWHTEGWL